MAHDVQVPSLSIVIPVFNRASLLAACLDSLPDVPEIEVIVVDDGSEDNSADVAQSFADHQRTQSHIIVLRQENAGPGAARNAGAAAARSKWVAFLDCDDLWAPRTVPTILQTIVHQSDCILIFLKTRDFLASTHPPTPDNVVSLYHRYHRFLEAVRERPQFRFGSGNVVVRHDVFDALGGFTMAIKASEDSDLFLRADSAGPVVCLSGPWLVGIRVGSGDNLSGNTPLVVAGFRYMQAQESAGKYGSYDRLRHEFLSRAAVHTIRTAFAQGSPGAAYKLWLQNFFLIKDGGQSFWNRRLPFTPLLSLLRPNSYPMRWPPRRTRR